MARVGLDLLPLYASSPGDLRLVSPPPSGMPTLRRLTAAFCTLLVLQLMLPGRPEMCAMHGAADPAMTGMRPMDHQGTERRSTRGMTHAPVSPDSSITASTRTDGVGAVGEASDVPASDNPCHEPGAMAACAAMPSCTSISALPVVQAPKGNRAPAVAVVGPSNPAPLVPGAAPDTPPPKA